jgi:hypothetical protein
MFHTVEQLSVDFIPLQVVTTVDTLQVSDGSLKQSNKTKAITETTATEEK